MLDIIIEENDRWIAEGHQQAYLSDLDGFRLLPISEVPLEIISGKRFVNELIMYIPGEESIISRSKKLRAIVEDAYRNGQCQDSENEIYLTQAQLAKIVKEGHIKVPWNCSGVEQKEFCGSHHYLLFSESRFHSNPLVSWLLGSMKEKLGDIVYEGGSNPVENGWYRFSFSIINKETVDSKKRPFVRPMVISGNLNSNDNVKHFDIECELSFRQNWGEHRGADIEYLEKDGLETIAIKDGITIYRASQSYYDGLFRSFNGEYSCPVIYNPYEFTFLQMDSDYPVSLSLPKVFLSIENDSEIIMYSWKDIDFGSHHLGNYAPKSSLSAWAGGHAPDTMSHEEFRRRRTEQSWIVNKFRQLADKIPAYQNRFEIDLVGCRYECGIHSPHDIREEIEFFSSLGRVAQ